MGSMIDTGSDVTGFLKEQHDDIRVLFHRVEETRGAERRDAFLALRRLLAVHETAEEEIVHPIARKKIASGEAIVDTRLEEERLAKQALRDLELLEVDSAEFEARFGAFKTSVLEHARAEEREEFDRLRGVLDPVRLGQMAKAVHVAERIAPTRPHPGIESATENFLIGPFAAIVDRARDAFVRRVGRP